MIIQNIIYLNRLTRNAQHYRHVVPFSIVELATGFLQPARRVYTEIGPFQAFCLQRRQLFGYFWTARRLYIDEKQ